MSNWSRNRKSLYAVIVAVVAIGLIGVPVFFYFYKAPTCSDGIRNQGEQGIDCGGPCTRLCPSSFIATDVSWTRYEEIAPKLYNLAAYVVNRNTDGGASAVPYHMVLYDTTGVPINDVSGMLTIPPHRNTLAFIPAVSSKERTPAKVLFEFTATPNWIKEKDPISTLTVSDKKYTEDTTGSSLQVNLNNSGVDPLNNIAVYVVLYDKDGNAIGFSKTVVDQIPGNGRVVAPFTWPINRHGAVISIEVLPVAE